jgi:hypothetical protein
MMDELQIFDFERNFAGSLSCIPKTDPFTALWINGLAN